MSTLRSSSKFICPSCGRGLDWSASLVGRSLTCPCGSAVQVPVRPQTTGTADETYDLNDDPPPSAASAPIPVASRPARVLKYQPAPLDQPSWRDAIRGSEFRHLILPCCFLVLAVLIRFGMVLFSTSSGPGQTLVLFGVALGTMALNVVTMFIGVGAVARFTGSDLGPLPIAVLKLAATAIVGSVIMGVGAALLPSYGAGIGIAAWHATIVIYWIMFSMFFEMDLQETLFAVALVGVMQALTMIILWQR